MPDDGSCPVAGREAPMLHVRWRFHCKSPARAIVLPDGCRDMICVTPEGGAARVLFTQWDDRPRSVVVPGGTAMTGFRLRPGAVIDERALAGVAADPERLREFLASEVRPDRELTEVIDALAEASPDAPGARIARRAGVTLRTLQRRFHAASLPPPAFWRLLGRARRAALALSHRSSLADIASAHGYSDQAHMTREFIRWFGSSPARLRRSPRLLAELSQPGLGNWTGEHISTR